MCGIFGYVGVTTDAAEKILAGLKTLEYRGYDSWGIVEKTVNGLEVDKHTGAIGTAQTQLPPSSLGIGHTRWATHGMVTQVNAHPHLDCTGTIALLHNGIAENYDALKQALVRQGHIFRSQTDSEVIVHLIEHHLRTLPFADAVRTAFNQLTGSNAILVITAASNEIIAAKSGSPLIAGIGDGGLYIASDIPALVKHTRHMVVIEEQQMVILGEHLRLFSLPTGEEIKSTIQKITWEYEEAVMGKYPHFMLKEIHEQPAVIRNIALHGDEHILELAQAIKIAKKTFFIGSGTAYHACITAMYLFSKIAKSDVRTESASEFTYLGDTITDESLVIALSQSGETIDIVEPLTRAKHDGATIASIVNTLGSTIYRMSEHKLLLRAGPEKAVASTKAYTAKLAMLIMVSYAMADRLDDAKAILLQAADEIERLLRDTDEQMRLLAKEIKHNEHIYLIGRGMYYPAALEAALKIKEISYIHAEGFQGGEWKHGPMALIEPGTPVIVFAPNGDTHEAIIDTAQEIKARDQILNNAKEIEARGAFMIGISPENEEVFDRWIKVHPGSVISTITQIIPMQLLSYYLAIEKGYNPDMPRNLAKSVTVK